jgi:hypothetical protein
LPVEKRAIHGFDPKTIGRMPQDAVEMGGSGNNTMGGILSNGKSAFEHLATYSGKLADVGNYNGPDVPGVRAFRRRRRISSATGCCRAPIRSTRSPAPTGRGLKYGQESTKFYRVRAAEARTHGGATRQRRALDHGGGASRLPANRKGIDAGRLSKRKTRSAPFGDAFLQQYNFRFSMTSCKTVPRRIHANIAKLRAAPAAPAAGGPGTAAIPPGWSVKVH